MHVKFRFIPFLFAIPLYMSCASNYKPIYPEKLQYHNQSINDNIEFSYPGFNMAIAGSANKHFRDELERYSPDRQIQNGETIYALVAFRDIGMDEITLRLK